VLLLLSEANRTICCFCGIGSIELAGLFRPEALAFCRLSAFFLVLSGFTKQRQ